MDLGHSSAEITAEIRLEYASHDPVCNLSNICPIRDVHQNLPSLHYCVYTLLAAV